eukprot:11374127-Karenia_brevis.AAC.1
MVTAAEKASGGCGVAVKRGMGISPHDSLVKQQYAHRFGFAWTAGVLRGGLHCGSVWLKDSEGLSETNRHLLDQIA